MARRSSPVALPIALAVALAVALMGVLGGVFAVPQAAFAAGQPEVRTPAGAVRGSSSGEVESFLGIPYAQPPTGPLRWRPAVAASSWSGVRAATAYGPRCPQLPSVNGTGTSLDENCLSLNVQRPAGAPADARLPVLVWIHGGAYANGASDQYDGSLLARAARGTIVVTLNYRLGVLGFLSTPELAAENSDVGNLGLTDQQLALRWVHDAIGAFGGDPAAVTLAGESSGGFAVCQHLVSPGSRGLFSAAVISSGACASRSQQAAQSASNGFALKAGCLPGAQVLACLRRRPVQQLLDVYGTTTSFPVHGTPSLPEDVAKAVDAGRFARVPVLLGANLDEGRAQAEPAASWGELEYRAAVSLIANENAGRVLAAYPWPASRWPGAAPPNSAAYLLGAMATDDGALLQVGGCSTRSLADRIARWAPVHSYEFAHRDGPGLSLTTPGYVSGAEHSADVPYLFPSYDQGAPLWPRFGPAERQLTAEMVGDWAAFAHSHAPGAGWVAHQPGGDTLQLRAGGTSRLITDAALSAEHHCDLWDDADLFSGPGWKVVLSGLGLTTG